MSQRLGNRELRLRSEAGCPKGPHCPENVEAVSHIRFANQGMPSAVGLEGDIERATTRVRLQHLEAHFLRNAPTPLRAAQPIELFPEFLLIEHGRQGASGFERHPTSFPWMTPVAKCSSSTAPNSRMNLSKCRDRGMSRSLCSIVRPASSRKIQYRQWPGSQRKAWSVPKRS